MNNGEVKQEAEETLESKLIECMILHFCGYTTIEKFAKEADPNKRKLVKRAIRALQYKIFKEKEDMHRDE